MPSPCQHANFTPHEARDYIQGGSYAQDAVCDQCGGGARRIVRYPGLHAHTIIAYVRKRNRPTGQNTAP